MYPSLTLNTAIYASTINLHWHHYDAIIGVGG
jgi:hypothetical protein